MKKIIVILTLTLVLLGGIAQNVMAAGGGSTTSVIDPVKIAGALANAGEWTTTTYTFSYVCYNPNTGVQKNKVLNGTYDNYWRVTTCVSDDGEVFLKSTDTPWSGLPSDTEGDRWYVNVWVNCQTPNGQVYGGFNAQTLPNGANFILDLRPGWVAQLLLFPSNLDPSTLHLLLANGGMSYYDWEAQGFWVWVDPESTSPVLYQIYQTQSNGTQITLQTGTVQYNGGGGEVATLSSTATATYDGCALPGYLNSMGGWMMNQLPFNSNVNGKASAVIFTNAHGQMLWVVGGGVNISVDVKDSAGLADIASAQSTQDQWGNWSLYLEVPAGHDGMVVIVTPVNAPGTTGWPWFQLEGTPASPNNGGGGLGAPKPQQ